MPFHKEGKGWLLDLHCYEKIQERHLNDTDDRTHISELDTIEKETASFFKERLLNLLHSLLAAALPTTYKAFTLLETVRHEVNKELIQLISSTLVPVGWVLTLQEEKIKIAKNYFYSKHFLLSCYATTPIWTYKLRRNLVEHIESSPIWHLCTQGISILHFNKTNQRC